MVEQLDDRLALDVVVLDDQEALGARGGEVPEALEGRLDALGGRRLDEVGKRAAGEDGLALFVDRDDLHGDVPRGRVELEVVQHGPAEHIGQVDVQGDGIGAELPGKGEARRAPGGHDHLEARVAGQAQDDPRLVRVVLDDEQ